MNNAEARFLLHACRPGGQDLADPALAPALEQMRRDPDLARWFERDQAFNAAVARKLAALPPPPGLREAILAGTRASLTPPRRTSRWSRPLWLASAAALFVLSAIAAWWSFAPIRGHTLDEFALNFVEHRFFLQKRTADVDELRHWLAARGGPLPRQLPSAFADLRALGCRTLDFKGHDVSLLCFERDGREFHIFVARREDLAPSTLRALAPTDRHGHTVAAWSDEQNHYVLVSDAPSETVQQLL